MTKWARDMTGEKHGRLTVLGRAPDGRFKQTRWFCRCDCGAERVVHGTGLRNGTSKSCGCLMKELAASAARKRVVDLVGQEFGRWTVIERAPGRPKANGEHHTMWLCACLCGTRSAINASSLRSGLSKSCGCLRVEVTGQQNKTHGKSRSPEHNIWNSIKDRTSNPNNKHFARYGGRGIAMCDLWRTSFESFLADIGPRPSPLHSLDRINNDGNYEPGNVRWATSDVQANNKSNNRFIDALGESLTVMQWERKFGVRRETITARIARGWSPEKAITASTRPVARARVIPQQGVYYGA